MTSKTTNKFSPEVRSVFEENFRVYGVRKVW